MIVAGAICTHLLSVTEITALTGQRVYRGHVPQSVDWSHPVVRVVQTGTDPQYDLDGEAGFGKATVQIDVWAVTWSETETVAQLIRQQLSAAQGTLGGVEFRLITLTNFAAIGEPPDDGSDAWEPRIVITLDCRFNG